MNDYYYELLQEKLPHFHIVKSLKKKRFISYKIQYIEENITIEVIYRKKGQFALMNTTRLLYSSDKIDDKFIQKIINYLENKKRFNMEICYDKKIIYKNFFWLLFFFCLILIKVIVNILEGKSILSMLFFVLLITFFSRKYLLDSWVLLKTQYKKIDEFIIEDEKIILNQCIDIKYNHIYEVNSLKTIYRNSYCFNKIELKTKEKTYYLNYYDHNYQYALKAIYLSIAVKNKLLFNVKSLNQYLLDQILFFHWDFTIKLSDTLHYRINCINTSKLEYQIENHLNEYTFLDFISKPIFDGQRLSDIWLNSEINIE